MAGQGLSGSRLPAAILAEECKGTLNNQRCGNSDWEHVADELHQGYVIFMGRCKVCRHPILWSTYFMNKDKEAV